mmetsp:Transcript_8057/g.17792  ORF Transcript_8057/g.17792 Transcript_8057/m.17792 type:complete len:188 (-) Transcript_8057:29-592(-)|eukprot:CAMPEP_0182809396 /NCGR_PEP_ID=MMETSP0006_2-20121128/7161_1 /TAXON_ID=97485 /ORGANISM="Prymnesium parvum, Strain Texoma1" /LENGTH=187 /DNA_ID=CAMNT_0024935177 /DNA_START=862 /DNA_END=1425 /DNA_ORIENTATION=+
MTAKVILARATLAGQYPWRLNVFLVRRHAWCAPSIRYAPVGGGDGAPAATVSADTASEMGSDAHDSADEAPPDREAGSTHIALPPQGLVGDGPPLRGAVQRAAELPPKFSSYRNLIPEDPDELLVAAARYDARSRWSASTRWDSRRASGANASEERAWAHARSASSSGVATGYGDSARRGKPCARAR